MREVLIYRSPDSLLNQLQLDTGVVTHVIKQFQVLGGKKQINNHSSSSLGDF